MPTSINPAHSVFLFVLGVLLQFAMVLRLKVDDMSPEELVDDHAAIFESMLIAGVEPTALLSTHSTADRLVAILRCPDHVLLKVCWNCGGGGSSTRW